MNAREWLDAAAQRHHAAAFLFVDDSPVGECFRDERQALDALRAVLYLADDCGAGADPTSEIATLGRVLRGTVTRALGATS